MDDVARYNRERWEAIAAAGCQFSRPFLDLTPETALALLDPHGVMGDPAGKDVLCLASGGGQQSVAFALLGARTTVFDLSRAQLDRDRDAAAHYGVEVRLAEGDMRDLSVFERDSFDIVWHAFSISFIPDPAPVFREVARVLRPGGTYRLEWTNPFRGAMVSRDWNGEGYVLRDDYVDGAELRYHDPAWEFEDEDGSPRRLEGPREFRHTLSSVINELAALGFSLLRLDETDIEEGGEPGSWAHFTRIAPPYLTLWARFLPRAAPPE
jgi:SAM-dependent methyltransferase